MTEKVTNEQCLFYLPIIKNRAARFVGRGGAEFDDLVQEGYIDVWTTLASGKTPAIRYIDHRMSRYCKWLGKIRKHGHISYDELLRMEIDVY